MNRLQNKSVFVTAAGMGIGRASAIAMAQEGATVYASDIDRPSLDSLAEEHSNIHCVELDVRDANAIERLPSRVPVPDVILTVQDLFTTER